MEKYQVTLTRADIWQLLGAMDVCESESVCFVDRKFEEELNPHCDWDGLKEKLEKIFYKE